MSIVVGHMGSRQKGSLHGRGERGSPGYTPKAEAAREVGGKTGGMNGGEDDDDSASDEEEAVATAGGDGLPAAAVAANAAASDDDDEEEFVRGGEMDTADGEGMARVGG